MKARETTDTGAVVLVSCYELGHQPMGLASPLAFLERAGYAASPIDITVEPLNENRLRNSRFLGISVPMHTALRLGIRVAERARAVNPACHICFYGLYASLNADYLLSGLADSVLGGEYEGALVETVRAVLGSDPQQERNPMNSDRGVHLEKLEFPAPARRNLRPLERYARLEYQGEERLAGYVEASRGCLHQCRHCPIPPLYHGRFFVVPRRVILQDIRRQVRAGAKHITFGDPDFLNGPGHSIRIARALHDEFPEVTFDFTAKIEHLLARSERLPELARLGCLFVVSAVESLSPRVLAILDKGHTREDVEEALARTRDAGMAFRPAWVPFTPWTTMADYLEILDWVASRGLIHHVDPVQYTIRLLLPPGSSLLGRPELSDCLGPLAPDRLTYEWIHPDPRMDALQRDVEQLVKQAAEEGRAAEETFLGVHALARSAAGGPVRDGGFIPPAAAGLHPPRLTESWFC